MAEHPQPSEINKDARTFGMLCHLLALSGFLTSGLGFILGPLIMWLIKKDEYPFVDDQGKEALNFQLTMLIGWTIAILSIFIFIGIVLIPLLFLTELIFIILATVKANEGEYYRYPFCIRFIQ